MSAAYHIHIMTDEISEDMLKMFYSNYIGHKWCTFEFDNPVGRKTRKDLPDSDLQKIYNTPEIFIGNVSWLKAAIFEDSEKFVPDTIGEISNMVDDGITVITDEFIDGVSQAFGRENSTGYNLGSSNKIVEFLQRYKGYRIFAISW